MKDVIDLMGEAKHIPKLEAVVNYGENTVLPEIIDVCNGEETIEYEEAGKRMMRGGRGMLYARRKVRTEPSDVRTERFQEKLLKSCSKEHSYLTYKQNHKNLLAEN